MNEPSAAFNDRWRARQIKAYRILLVFGWVMLVVGGAGCVIGGLTVAAAGFAVLAGRPDAEPAFAGGLTLLLSAFGLLVVGALALAIRDIAQNTARMSSRDKE